VTYSSYPLILSGVSFEGQQALPALSSCRSHNTNKQRRATGLGEASREARRGRGRETNVDGFDVGSREDGDGKCRQDASDGGKQKNAFLKRLISNLEGATLPLSSPTPSRVLFSAYELLYLIARTFQNHQGCAS
jgi:hypothetical protein